MNNELVRKAAGIIELLIDSSSRINEAKPTKYWYPLSMATFGVEEIVEALDSMCAFRTSMWEKTQRFERNFADYQGARHAVMVNSGSSADLLLSLLLTDPVRPLLPRGSTILVPAVTWPTQLWSPLMAGMNVKIVDVDPRTLNIDLEDLERKIDDSVKALFLVHLMGNPCQMDRILEIARTRNLLILEDCCEALGAEWNGQKVGNFGIGGSFSFFFAHHMTTMEGGMVVVNDDRHADTLRVLRAHGWLRNVDPKEFGVEVASADIDPRYTFVDWGLNVRPTEIQAGFGIQQLLKLPSFQKRREDLAHRFWAFVDGCEWLERPVVRPEARPSWMALPFLVRDGAPFSRQALVDYLELAGIETRPVVAGNLSRQPVARVFPSLFAGSLAGADSVHQRGLYIGLTPLMPDASMDRLLETFDKWIQRST